LKDGLADNLWRRSISFPRVIRRQAVPIIIGRAVSARRCRDLESTAAGNALRRGLRFFFFADFDGSLMHVRQTQTGAANAQFQIYRRVPHATQQEGQRIYVRPQANIDRVRQWRYPASVF